jgi:hypothetical protein
MMGRNRSPLSRVSFTSKYRRRSNWERSTEPRRPTSSTMSRSIKMSACLSGILNLSDGGVELAAAGLKCMERKRSKSLRFAEGTHMRSSASIFMGFTGFAWNGRDSSSSGVGNTARLRRIASRVPPCRRRSNSSKKRLHSAS